VLASRVYFSILCNM
jgi:cold shock CspA family protein